MSGPLEGVVKRWTAKRKSALVIEIIQGKTTVAEASRSYDLFPIRRHGAERALVNRSLSDLGRKGRLDLLGLGHRLPHA